MASVKVFGLPASTDVARVLTCLFEKEIEFQLIRTHTYNGDHKVPEFLKLQNPAGQVTYKEGNHTLVDSRETCRHISEKFTDKGNKYLLGTGALERASIEQWLQAEAHNFDPPSSVLLFQLAFAVPTGITPSEELIRKNEKELSKVLDVYERRLGESEYLGGDVFTLADLTHLPNSHYLISTSKMGEDLFMSRENVKRWWKAISGRSSWRKVVQMQSDYVKGECEEVVEGGIRPVIVEKGVQMQTEHPGPLEKLTIKGSSFEV